MAERPVYVTAEGYQQLERELDELKTYRRDVVARRLHDALKEGELIENAELEDARREQSFVEGRIYTLEQTLRNAQIIEKNADAAADTVTLGSHVTVSEKDFPGNEEYQLVGSAEADPARGKISNESPLGKALLGKKVGELATFSAPGGDITFEIISIR